MEELSEPQSATAAPLVARGIRYALVAAVFFAGGFALASHESGASLFSNVPLIGDGLNPAPASDVNLADFWKAWNLLDQRFVITHASSTLPTTQQRIYGAIQGLTASYGDPYTVFMPPQQAKQFAENIAGNFVGVGIELGENKDGVLQVIAPLKDTPAEKAGVKPGDLIAAIDNKSTQGMSTDDAVAAIRGKAGTTVTFEMVRNGKPLTIPVVRATIQVPEIDYKNDPATGVYTIALYEFTANSAELFDKALADWKASGSKKLVIDLRGNPGGYLDAAVNIASHFLPEGDVIVTEDYKGKQQNVVHRSIGTDDVPTDVKIAILIDQGSASASEILSGAMQDQHRATLIGTRSFGKGSVQELTDLDGGSLKITVARWLTPSGKNISDGGLTPDIKADRTADDFAAGKDPQYDRAVQFLTTGK